MKTKYIDRHIKIYGKKILILSILCMCQLLLFSCKQNAELSETVKVEETSEVKIETTKAKIDFEKISESKLDTKTGYLTVKCGKYKNEDLEWLVIDKNDDTVLLLSKNIIDCKNYNDTKEEVVWKDSTLRTWLNENFIKEAFDETYDEKFGNINSRNFGFVKGDKISLLNIDMCEKYFGTEDANKRNLKITAKATTFAKNQGVECDDHKNTDFYDCGSFFLTDNGSSLDKAVWVGQYGHIYKEGQPVKLETGDGIRPIICLKTEVLANGVIDSINSNIFNIETIENLDVDDTIENVGSDELLEETENENKKYVYSNVSKYTFQSENVPCSEKNVIDLKSWKYGKTPVEWVYVNPNTQIISNNSPNKSSKFGYKQKASSGKKGCYMVAFTGCDEVKGTDYDGRLYSFEDYTKIPLEELKFNNKFAELKYGDYNVLELLKKKYEMIDISKGVYMAGDVYVNVIYVDELDEIISDIY